MNINYLKYELKYSIIICWKKLLLLAVAVFLLCVEFDLKAEPPLYSEKLTIGDRILSLFAGAAPYDRSANVPFQFPIRWVLINMIICFCVLSYPKDSLTGVGTLALLRLRKRSDLWNSYCIWCFVAIIAIYLIIWLILLGFSLKNGEKLSFSLSKEFVQNNMNMSFIDENIGSPYYSISPTKILLPLIVSITFTFLQMLLSFAFSRAIGFVLISIMILLSSYYDSPLLIGTYGMIGRSDCFYEHGFSVQSALLFCLLLLILIYVIGYIYFKNFNIMKKGKK